MRLISREKLRDMIEGREDFKLVFVLGEWQYRSMHIPGSLNIPCSPSLYQSLDALEGLDPSDDIVVYCSTELCYASISVYHLLEKRGFRNVSRYAGGLLDWEDAGFPLDGEMTFMPAASISS